MKAVLLKKAGGSDMLELRDVPRPGLPGPEHILVRLRAAGINPVDFKMRQAGTLSPDRLPAVLGCDGAGEVEEIGHRVTRFKVGDEVYFFNGGIGGPEQGNYAEYTVIHQDFASRKPKNLSMTEAAAVPLVWITANEALLKRAKLQKGQTVLIQAGAGGVGHTAIQVARLHGARIATTVSSREKADFVRSLGANYPINYRESDFVEAVLNWTSNLGVDVVFDTVGGKPYCRSFAAACIYGTVVTLLQTRCEDEALDTARNRNLSLAYELMLSPMHLGMHEGRRAQREILDEATRRIEAGEVRIQVNQTFPLEEVARAHQLIEEGHMKGKIVLEIN
ncbi:MAG: zinc-dependent alcohol dehydrogenase family protein [Thermodesulfobacteriota bacterium]